MEDGSSLGDYPTEWAGIFDVIASEGRLKSLVADFGVKFRLSNQLTSSAFAGDTAASDSYYVLLKASLLYSAIEAWELVAGKHSVELNLAPIAAELRGNKNWPDFYEALVSALSSKNLKLRLQAFQSGETDDLVLIISAIRHGFFHPGLNATNSSLYENSNLRAILLRLINSCRAALNVHFNSWARDTRRWFELNAIGDDKLMGEAKNLGVIAGHAKRQIEQQYKMSLTEIQWSIIVEEVWQEDELSAEECIAEVIENLSNIESDYEFWTETKQTAEEGQLASDKESKEDETKDRATLRDGVKELMLGWVEIEPSFSPESVDMFFAYVDVELEDGLTYARPTYLLFAKNSVFIDAPVCRMNEVPDLANELGPWALGKVGVAMTYHNVLNYELIDANPTAAKHLLEMIIKAAGKREFEILGVRHFLKRDDKSAPAQTSNEHSTDKSVSTESVLSEEQLDELRDRIQDLQEVIQKFGIGYEAITPERAVELYSTNSNTVFSLLEDDWGTPSSGLVREVGYGLRAGYVPGSSAYFTSSKPFQADGVSPYPYTEIRFDCLHCNQSGCELCADQGVLVFELGWDSFGQVFAEQI